MTATIKPDKAITPEPKVTVILHGLTLFSQEFIDIQTYKLNNGFDLVLDPKDPLINNLISFSNIDKEFNETVTNIINSQMSKNKATDYLKNLISFGLSLNNYYYYDMLYDGVIRFLEDDILNSSVLYSDKDEKTGEAKRINNDELKTILLLRYYKAKLEHLRKFILDHYDLIKFFKSGKTETHKQLFIGQKYICTIPSDKIDEAKQLVYEFLVKGVSTDLLKVYVKVSLEIL